MVATQKLQLYDTELVRAIAYVLAQTDWPGLSGRQIDYLLQMVKADKREAGLNKREGLHIALHNTQVRQHAGNAVVAFVNGAMSPARYVSDARQFEELRTQLNEVMILYKYRVTEEGKFATARRGATTLTEAAQLAGRLQTELRRRGTHEQLFHYCNEELLSRSLFHAMSEASKSIPNRVRELTGALSDGQILFTGAFVATGGDVPKLTINDWRTESEQSEQRGFVNLLIGIHGHYRNPRAHSSRVKSSENEHDFLDAFCLFSYVHRRIDSASTRP